MIREFVQTSMTPRSETDFLAESPRAMAEAIVEMEQVVKYGCYALGIIGFFVWILLMSRR